MPRDPTAYVYWYVSSGLDQEDSRNKNEIPYHVDKKSSHHVKSAHIYELM